MMERFIFRQVNWKDIATFAKDGEIKSPNHISPQKCHQTSYSNITERRGEKDFTLPIGGTVNDCVAFYFSPITAFTDVISRGEKVDVISPQGINLGKSSEDDRVFIVCKISDIKNTDLTYCFSNSALNTRAPFPEIETNIDEIENHINWNYFDEEPLVGKLPQIGYTGVCKYYFSDNDKRATRRPKRMAEFLIKNALPLKYVTCIIAKTDDIRVKIVSSLGSNKLHIPIFIERGCYYK